MDMQRYTEENLRNTAANSYNFSEWSRNLGRSVRGTNDIVALKVYAQRYNIDITHFDRKIRNKRAKRKITDDIMFSKEYSTLKQRGGANNKRVIDRLVELGRTYACDSCGISNWNEKPLRLQLEHINGDNRDYRKENLSFLCPNCHSQTATFSKGLKNASIN